jgi:MoxR-like ATPase
MEARFEQVDAAQSALEATGYIANREIAVAAFLMDALEKPLLVEGPSGVGKTELAKALSLALGRPLIRLQCYEGLDESRALYEWEYGKQLLYADMLRPLVTRMLEGSVSLHDAVNKLSGEASALFDPRFLLARPLLSALTASPPALLLIDEVDRADPEFEALLLEVLSDFQVSIPELGTIRATARPRVLLTSNRTREMTDALRRRCLYLHLDYPEPSREQAILRAQLPELEANLSAQIVAFVARARKLELKQRPSVAETIDWARTLVLLSADSLDHALVSESLVALAKQAEDRAELEALLTATRGTREADGA